MPAATWYAVIPMFDYETGRPGVLRVRVHSVADADFARLDAALLLMARGADLLDRWLAAGMILASA